jgi:hypothetical protein
MDDVAALIADLRDPKSAGHLGALDRVRFKGGETRLGGKDLGEPDPNGAARAAVVRALAAEKRRENVPVLHLLLREEAICCKKQWGGSELLHEIGLALAGVAEPMSVPVLMWAMDQSFDCYSMLDEDVMRPFFTPKTIEYLRQQAATADPARRELARKGEKYLTETFGGA